MSKAVFACPNPRIKLKPADWFWASWRNLPPLPRPAVPPFDQAEACQRIVNKIASSYNWQWEKLKISPLLPLCLKPPTNLLC